LSTPTPRVVLVGVDLGHPHFDTELAELALLAQTAGYEVAHRMVCKRRVPDAALFVGSGKADEIGTSLGAYNAQEVLFDQALSPAQQRNLERHLVVPVNDRTLLILDIFAQRARSHEGKLQVELARLQYLATRLVRRWSHLERQRGGQGLRGGPGETQIELDRRMIGTSIKRVRERLHMVQRQRQTQRRRRLRAGVFNVSLVGYTNAGKSSLFNALVKSGAYVANQLFATLDTTTRAMYLPEAQLSVSLSDTVGFIRDLPHDLVAAFSATLQEAVQADLLLHVVDATDEAAPERMAQVQEVLSDIGAGEVPQVVVFNKIDALASACQPRHTRDELQLGAAVWPRIFVSAHTAQGLPQLRQVLAEQVAAAQAQHPSTVGL
jgi:GTP-binding protein HflX